jgi:hypothetical protein
MRRFRRGGVSGLEFASSGEDSFVAVVVTKLTGALLFILLLAMVIMALLPKGADFEQSGEKSAETDPDRRPGPLEIVTPATLPDAVAGRPYLVALAAVRARGQLQWSAEGSLPGWLTLDEASGQICGTPTVHDERPREILFQVTDGTQIASRTTHLLVLPSSAPAPAVTWWKPRWAVVVPWGAWLQQGVGFLVLWVVHLFGMSLLTNLEHHALEGSLVAEGAAGQTGARKRFAQYRLLVRLATLTATISLGLWLFWSRI